MKSPDNATIRIGAWRVDPALDEISKDGKTVKLEPKIMRLLVCLAEHAGQVVSVEQLLNEVWKDVIVTSDSVYRAVAALRRLLGNDTKDPSYIVNVLRRGYRLVAPVAPYVDAPAAPETDQLATPEQATTSTETAAPPAAPEPSSMLQRSAIALIIALALLLAYLVDGKFWPSNFVTAERLATGATTAVIDKSIAVLPFVDMSENKDQEYFADGMAEEVLDLLASVPGVRVIGRTSSFQFKGKSADLRTVGGALGAAYIVEGSVRKSGERLRVTAQLVGAQNGSHLWSQTYDGVSGDVLTVQDQIAAGIVRALQVTVGADDLQSQPISKSADAYDLYLRGRHAFDRFDKGGFETAAAYFQQALGLDPSCIRAAEWLAITHEALAEMGFVPPREGYEQARASAERAVKLNPQSAIAHSFLAHIHAIYDWDWAAAAAENARALALEPRNAVVLEGAGAAYAALGQWDAATRLYDASLALDPLSSPPRLMLGHIRDRTGRFTEAEVEYRKVLEISPSYVYAHFYVGRTLLFEGRLEAALAEMRQETADGGRDLGLAIVYHAMGRNAESDAALAQYAKAYADNQALAIAEVHAFRGEIDQAFAWLDRAYGQKDIGLYEIKVSPLLKNLESDPRYKAFLRKMKLPTDGTAAQRTS